MTTTTAPTGTTTDETWWLDARLLTLDPDLEELFAEVEDILRAAVPRIPRPGPDPAPAPRPRRPGRPRPAGQSARRRSRAPAPICRPGRGPPRPEGGLPNPIR